MRAVSNLVPRISGRSLTALAALSRTRAGARTIQEMFRHELRISSLEAIPEALRGPIPLHTRAWQGRAPRTWEDKKLALPAEPWSPTVRSIDEAFRERRITPRSLMERVLGAARGLEAKRPSLGPFCFYADAAAHALADAATTRRELGQGISVYDGIPYAVKEELSVAGMPQRVGSAIRPMELEQKDATLVDRLHRLGAIVCGSTSMTEFGLSPSGANAKRTMPRNPHGDDRLAGGSSTGSAVAVATGLVPFAIGGDGGGSIRIPAALCGIFGIKPTWGRVSRHGDFFTGSVSHVGPMASSTCDLARVLEAISGHDPEDSETDAAPAHDPGAFVRALGRGVAGLVIGVPEDEWADASEPVARAGREVLHLLEREGAKLVPLNLSLAKHALAIGTVTIATESRVGLRQIWLENRTELSPDLELSLAAVETFSAAEYLDTARLREGLRREMREVFGRVDVLAMPTTKTVAPQVTESEMDSGFSDPSIIDALCRFTFLANLTGLPAASAPIGRDRSGMPIGFQIVGDAWDEASVLAVSAHIERIGAARIERPLHHVDILG